MKKFNGPFCPLKAKIRKKNLLNKESSNQRHARYNQICERPLQLGSIMRYACCMHAVYLNSARLYGMCTNRTLGTNIRVHIYFTCTNDSQLVAFILNLSPLCTQILAGCEQSSYSAITVYHTVLWQNIYKISGQCFCMQMIFLL